MFRKRLYCQISLYIELCSKYLMLNIKTEHSLRESKMYSFVFGQERDRVSADTIEVADEVEIKTSLQTEERWSRRPEERGYNKRAKKHVKCKIHLCFVPLRTCFIGAHRK